MTKIVIIGGGPAGYEAAITAATSHADVTLVENDAPGGACVLHDCVPSKTFIASTGVKTEVRRANALGIDVKHGNDAEVFRINQRIKDLAHRQSDDIRQHLHELGVTVCNGHAEFAPSTVDGHHIIVDSGKGNSQSLRADTVLIATGATPRILPGAEPDGERILNWRDIYNLQQLPEHLVVVGSGVTGSEFVHAFTELGVQVTVLSATDRMLPNEDADAALVLENVLSERGVKLIKNAKAESVKNTGQGVVITTVDGREINASHCLMTVGSVPNTSRLGLEKVGITVNAHGYIPVDRASRTSVLGIYAAGDCTGVLPLASVAAMQGRIAMHHALGEDVSPLKLKTVGSAIFTRPEIASVGISQKDLDNGTHTARSVVLPLNSNPRSKMLALRRGFVKIFCRPATGEIIGGTIVAPNASELILTLSLAVRHHLTVADLSASFSVYPSLSGSITEASRRLVRYDLE